MTPEADLLYEIFSIHYAVSGSDTFTIRFQGFDAYESWLNDMAGMSVIEPAAVPETQDRIVTLSTCTEDSSRRMTVQGKLIWKGNPYEQTQAEAETQGAA